MFKIVAILSLLTIVYGQAPALPSYYNRPSYYPTSLYNPSQGYPQASTSIDAALAYQQEQNQQRQQALAAYQQQANAAGLPQSYPLTRPGFTSSPSVNYSPQNLPAVNYQSQNEPGITYNDAPRYQQAPQSAYNPQPAYTPQQAYNPQTSYNPQGLQTISYQPSNEQSVSPVTNYDPQPAPANSYNPQPAYNADEIAALQRQRDAEAAIQRQRQNEIALQRQRESELALQRQRESEQLAALQRQREIEINLRRQKEAEIAIQREREAALAVQAQRDAIAAQERARQQAQAAQAAQQAQQAQQAQAAQQAQQAQQAQAAQAQRYNPPPTQPSYNYQPPSRSIAPTTTEAPKVHRPAEIFYSKIGEQLNGDYTFGYHTGKGENDNSFREEKRLPDGTVTGAYGFIDKNGQKHVVKYTAGKDGFKVEGDVDPNIAAASQAANKLPPLVEPSPTKPSAPVYQPPASSYQPPASSYQPPASSYRPPVSQPISQPTYQPTYQPPSTTPAPIAYRPAPIRQAEPSTVSASASSAFEEARAQIAANRNRPIQSGYQAPIQTPNQYHSRQNLGQNLSYKPPTRTVAPQQPVGTHLATSASSYPTAARINSRAVRKLLQTRHRQQHTQPNSIDTSASSSSSIISQPIVKLKTSSSVQILSRPPPAIPNYRDNPVDPNFVRMNRARAIKAFTNSGSIETSASSSKLSYTPSETVAKKPVEQPVTEVKSTVENKVESKSDNVEISNDKLESRSDDNIESRNDSPVTIDFPTIAMNSFLSRI